MMGTAPIDLIEELRQEARHSFLETEGDIPFEDIIEWEAADWMEACCALLEKVKEAGGDMALTAIELLAGDFPKTEPVGSFNRWT